MKRTNDALSGQSLSPTSKPTSVPVRVVVEMSVAIVPSVARMSSCVAPSGFSALARVDVDAVEREEAEPRIAVLPRGDRRVLDRRAHRACRSSARRAD